MRWQAISTCTRSFLEGTFDCFQEVGRLQESLKVAGDVAYTCETAGYFYMYQVLARWEEFLGKIRKLKVSFIIIRRIHLHLLGGIIIIRLF